MIYSESYKKFKQLKIDKSLLQLEIKEKFEDYFCYPLNAKYIGFEQFIMYTFIDGKMKNGESYGDMVFVSNPTSSVEDNVYPLALNFLDFLRLILFCGSANPLEQIVWMTKEKFLDHCENEKASFTQLHKEALEIIQKDFNISPMQDPYEYVKNLQANYDKSGIIYSDDYYDTLGIIRE